MLIVHGVRIKKERMGVVAELCPRCRDIRPAVVTSVSSYHHVYFVPVSKNKLLRYEVMCRVCKLARPMATVSYLDYMGEDPDDIGLLVEATNPGVVERLADRIALDERIADGTATREDRIRLMTEVITDAAFRVQAKLATALWTTAVLIFVCIGLFIAWTVMLGNPHMDSIITYSLGGGLLAVVCLTIRSAATGKQRWVRKNVAPGLAKELAYLGPTGIEVGAAVAAVKHAKLKLGGLLGDGRGLIAWHGLPAHDHDFGKSAEV